MPYRITGKTYRGMVDDSMTSCPRGSRPRPLTTAAVSKFPLECQHPTNRQRLKRPSRVFRAGVLFRRMPTRFPPQERG